MAQLPEDLLTNKKSASYKKLVVLNLVYFFLILALLTFAMIVLLRLVVT